MEPTMSMTNTDQLVAAGGKFLRAITVKPGLMPQMIGLGYSEAEHRRGWDYYLKMLGYVGAAKMVVTTLKDTDQAHALAEIDSFDEPHFRRASVALNHLHPVQYTYVFGDGLSPKTGAESVGSVQTFLDRYAALRDGTDAARADSREADKAAATTLESRNIVTPTIEQHLRALIDIVKSGNSTGSGATSEESLQGAAKTFAQWFQDWRATASVGITRRDFRIMLGISRRRAADANPAPAPEPPVAQPPADQPPAEPAPAVTPPAVHAA